MNVISQGAQEGSKKANIDNIIDDIDILNISRNLAFAEGTREIERRGTSKRRSHYKLAT